uniref:Uncharacterized protein n=1 Tax=Arundo donax TaxID=35708 RepID=A0A0A8YXU5_ARUDO
MLCQQSKYEQALEIFNKSFMQDAEMANPVLTVFVRAFCKQATLPIFNM